VVPFAFGQAQSQLTVELDDLEIPSHSQLVGIDLLEIGHGLTDCCPSIATILHR